MNAIDADAKLLAAASHVAYDTAEQISAWAANHGFAADTFNEPETDIQGFVAHNEQKVILAFRGSASRVNWLVNANLALRDHLHAGFAEAMEKSWEPHIVPRLNRAGAGPIHITGHSLGGALALLAARRVGARVSKLVTFGQPRAVDEVAAAECQRAFGDRYLRVVDDKDAVPRVPAFTGGYRHCGGAVRIGGDRNFIFSNRVETAEDAVRLFTGRDVFVPAAFETVLPLLENRVDRLAAMAGGGVEVIENAGDRLGSILGAPLMNFIDRFDGALNRTARLKAPGGLEAPEILEDHKMLNYLAALER